MRISDWRADVCSSDLRSYLRTSVRIVCQLLQRHRKRAFVAGRHNERTVLGRYHINDNANSRRYRRTGCSHRFHQRNRELLTVRRQSKYIKKADKVPWFVHEARQTKVTETTRSRLRPDSAALRPLAHDHQLKFVVMGRDGANKPSPIDRTSTRLNSSH